MNVIRVLVVDDSVVVRRALTSLLEGEPGILVTGAAANGRIALSKLKQESSDVVVLDVDMPEMDGLETLAEIRRHHPHVRVIMFSVLTERGAGTTLEALFRGAQDYVTKPGGMTDPESAALAVREQLLPKIRALAPPGRGADRRAVAAKTPRRARSQARLEAVVIAASTGGPAALEALLGRLPHRPPVPLLVVQHMPALFTGQLARQLAAKTGLDVHEARHGETVRAGIVLVAPGEKHLAVRLSDQGIFAVVEDGPPVNSCRPSADVLFLSAAGVWGAGVTGVVLTGMGRDGLDGGRAIDAAGGRLLAQDPASSVVWGMPGAVVEGGLAEEIGSPSLLGDRLNSLMARAGRRP